MASSKKMDWWETFLYLGLFLLIALFLYQLLQLWNKGVATATNGWAAISQAATNTIASIETGFQNLLTAPATFLANLLGGFPDLLNLVFSFFSNLVFGNIITGTLSFIGSIFGGFLNLFSTTSTAPITSGAGAYAGFSDASLIPTVDQTSPGFPSINTPFDPGLIGGAAGPAVGPVPNNFNFDTGSMGTTN
jgi:hypothetical protein